MKIYLLSCDKTMTEAWEKVFASVPKVEIVHAYFDNFMENHPEIDGVVSPGNSFGLMDGGYDKAIIDCFGKELMEAVQKKIIHDWHGEQPVGTSISVIIPNCIVRVSRREKYVMLIHTPTMRTPERINDPRIIYQCMRTTLIEAEKQEVENIVIPAFGGATGRVAPSKIAQMMYLGYTQYKKCPDELSWEYALMIENSLRNNDLCFVKEKIAR